MDFELDEICGDDLEEENPAAGNYQADHKPEYFQYKDEGCAYAQSCLSCPFPKCLYEGKGGGPKQYKKMRNKEIKKLSRSGQKVKELAQRFKISERTIRRALKAW